MKVKWSGIGMVAGSGKINGSVASKNRAGAYVRTKVTPNNPQTLAQVGIRASFSVISALWRGLTDVQRASWNSAVSNWTRTDIFGDIKTPSGFNLFMRLCTPLQNTFNDVIIANYAPSPVPMPLFGTLSAVAPTTAGVATALVINGLVNNPEAVDLEEYAIQLYATPSLSQGKSFVKNEFRYIGFIEFSELNETFLADYVARFGVLNNGNNVVVRAVVLSRATGQLSTPVDVKVVYTGT